jgi:hypothetical protein
VFCAFLIAYAVPCIPNGPATPSVSASKLSRAWRRGEDAVKAEIKSAGQTIQGAIDHVVKQVNRTDEDLVNIGRSISAAGKNTGDFFQFLSCMSRERCRNQTAQSFQQMGRNLSVTFQNLGDRLRRGGQAWVRALGNDIVAAIERVAIIRVDTELRSRGIDVAALRARGLTPQQTVVEINTKLATQGTSLQEIAMSGVNKELAARGLSSQHAVAAINTKLAQQGTTLPRVVTDAVNRYLANNPPPTIK